MMDHPYYTATVANLTRGWSYTATEGISPDPADAVILAAPFTYAWAFKNEQVPGQIEATTAAFNLAATTATALPEIQIGDLVTLDVRVGTTGARIIAPPPFRVAEPIVALGSGSWPARMQVPMSDLSVDWRDKKLGTPLGQPTTNPGGDQRDARPYWLERGAEIATIAEGGLSIGVPSWWGAQEVDSTLTDSGGRHFNGMAYSGFANAPYQGALPDVLEAFINTHQPGGFTHTWVTVYDPTGHPTGFEWIGPATWVTGTDSAIPAGGPLSDPDTDVRVEAVPASRKLDAGTAGLPLELAVVAGMLTIVPRDTSADAGHMTLAGLDADWCILPATARRARDSVANTINLNGFGRTTSGETDPSTGIAQYSRTQVTRTYSDATDLAARGPLPRDVPTMLYLGDLDTGAGYTGWPEAQLVIDNFMSDDSALNAPWGYDAFTLVSSLMPQDVADWLLPAIAPRLPDETDGDGRLVRHVTIYDIKPGIRFSGGPVVGFVTGGSLQIGGGDMIWTLSTAPGLPVWAGGIAPDPITIGDIATDFPTITFADVDPHMSFADLNYVGAP